MRVRLKRLHSAYCRLADGRKQIYYYAWRGGPRLQGEPGTAEFITSYNEAFARKVVAPGGTGTMISLLQAYQESGEFRDKLAERTKRDYIAKIQLIERKFGDMPLAALADARSRDVFLTWRDSLPGNSRRQSDYAITVLAAVLGVGPEAAQDQGQSACEPGPRLSRIPPRQDLDLRR
jgi:hypothetical protein